MKKIAIGLYLTDDVESDKWNIVLGECINEDSSLAGDLPTFILEHSDYSK